jgi:hypothetical protein
MDLNESLIYKICIIKGLEIDDLSKSLLSINDEFRRFTNGSKSLLVKEIRNGSGIFEFFEMLIAPSILFIENINTCVQFIEYLSSIKEILTGNEEKLPNDMSLSNKTIENAHSIFSPVINGDNNIVSITYGDKAEISVNQKEYRNIFDGKNKIKQLKSKEINVSDNKKKLHRKVLFRWLQARFDNSKSGNRGIIESIQLKPVKTIFENDSSETKREMTTSHSNVDWQKVGYIIDVETIVQNDNIVAYKVIKNYPDDSIIDFDFV